MYKRAFRKAQKCDSDCQVGKNKPNAIIQHLQFTIWKLPIWDHLEASARGRDGNGSLPSQCQAQCFFKAAMVQAASRLTVRLEYRAAPWRRWVSTAAGTTSKASPPSSSWSHCQTKITELDESMCSWQLYSKRFSRQIQKHTHTHTYALYLLCKPGSQSRHFDNTSA